MVVFAHRGASAYAPENTMTSFKKALEMGATAIELDVQLSKDRELVIIHDYTLKRTTDGKGYVKNHTLKELKRLDAGGWYGEEFRGEEIPTLKEILDEIPEKILVNVEVKRFIGDLRDVSKPLINILEACGRKETVIISSFNHSILKKIRELDKEVKIGMLFSGKLLDTEKYSGIQKIKPYSLHPPQEHLDMRHIKELKATGCKIYTYTVNSKERMEELKKLGVSGIFSDYPDI